MGSGGTTSRAGLGEGGSPNPDTARLAPNRSSTSRSRLRHGPSPSWSQRCEVLFEDLRRPARAMVTRAYGRALSDDQVEDVYAAAWAATLSALRGRGESMTDDELRAYVFTAVASHASKEMRRRSRKPAGSLEDAHEQVLYDVHAPLPDEAAIGLESSSVARDLLSSLPQRRRAVMLLRYGWGMSPKEVCALVSGLSPRAYRKEITRGVEQLIDRLKQVESGEWCESREPILRDYVAGTAGEDAERQALQHVQHCRACADLVARLSSHLHDLGGAVALASVAESMGGGRGPVIDRLSALLDRGRELSTVAAERGETAVGSIAASGGARGSGVAGAGVLAKVASFGAVGKAAAVCIGTGAAATACVAAGVVPGVSLPDLGGHGNQPRAERAAQREGTSTEPTVPTDPSSVTGITGAEISPQAGKDGTGTHGGTAGQGQQETKKVPTASEGAPADSVAPTAPAVDQEFVVPAAAPTADSSAGTGGPAAPAGGTSSGSGASGGQIGQEFGP